MNKSDRINSQPIGNDKKGMFRKQDDGKGDGKGGGKGDGKGNGKGDGKGNGQGGGKGFLGIGGGGERLCPWCNV